MKEQIMISEFKIKHNLSNVRFSRLRAKAERLNPGIEMTSYHHEGRHNCNILLRADLLEALLPLPKLMESEVNLNDLYARIAKLEAEVSKQRPARQRLGARRRSELSGISEAK